MAEYIEREAALNIFASSKDNWKSHEATACISAIPAADVAPVRHGKWINQRADSEMCSACGTRFYISALFAVGGNDEPPYCPYCGAKMNLEE